jgi:7-cyano-7-deazaguanine synthase
VGAMLPVSDTGAISRLQLLFSRSHDRGRDSAGLIAVNTDGSLRRWNDSESFATGPYSAVGNLRGEPTTEWVRKKTEADVQPFVSPSGRWVFTHNGTIANDVDIRAEYAQFVAIGVAPDAIIYKPPTQIDSYAIGCALDMWGFPAALHHLKGSFAILAIDTQEGPQTMYWAANYKPLYVLGSIDGTSILFASQKSYFERMYHPLSDPGPVALGPYEYGTVTLSYEGMAIHRNSLYQPKVGPRRVLAVCSGGLDSSVAAWWHAAQGDAVTLLHLQYGCKAEYQEVAAVRQLAGALGSPPMLISTDFFTHVADSALTSANGRVNHSNGGRDGAEFAHEWVPARNLVMASLAMAIAERHGFDAVSFGTNLEESGAYPDNEPEFLNRLADISPYAVRAYQRVAIESPVANLMKKEIVELGRDVHVPFELTWSCYEGGVLHCGTCGPDHMRKTAFAMAGIPDPTRYKDETGVYRGAVA